MRINSAANGEGAVDVIYIVIVIIVVLLGAWGVRRWYLKHPHHQTVLASSAWKVGDVSVDADDLSSPRTSCAMSTTASPGSAGSSMSRASSRIIRSPTITREAPLEHVAVRPRVRKLELHMEPRRIATNGDGHAILSINQDVGLKVYCTKVRV